MQDNRSLIETNLKSKEENIHKFMLQYVQYFVTAMY